jgi:hypothetical protein
MTKDESQPTPRWPWLGPAFRVRRTRTILEELIERDASEQQWCFVRDGERPVHPEGRRPRRSR